MTKKLPGITRSLGTVEQHMERAEITLSTLYGCYNMHLDHCDGSKMKDQRYLLVTIREDFATLLSSLHTIKKEIDNAG